MNTRQLPDRVVLGEGLYCASGDKTGNSLSSHNKAFGGVNSMYKLVLIEVLIPFAIL